MRVKGVAFFTGQLHFFLGVGSSEITCSLKGRQIFSCNAEAGTSKSRRNTKFDISINPRPSMQNFWYNGLVEDVKVVHTFLALIIRVSLTD